MKLKSVKDLSVAKKTVLLRVDFNVPVQDGVITDDARIKAALPTINYLIEKKAKVLVVSHFGRPQQKDMVWDKAASLQIVAKRLGELIGRKTVMIEGKETKLPEYDVPQLYFFSHDLEKFDLGKLSSQLKSGDVALLENIRFYKGEENNDPEFVERLASLADLFVNDAFAASHRDHASVSGVAAKLPSAAGLLLLQEVSGLERATHRPAKPVVIMMGGVKLSDKAAALEKLAGVADYILLGGGLANLFLKIQGYEIGKSVWEEKGETGIAEGLLRDYKDKISLPLDVVVSRKLDGKPHCVPREDVGVADLILDVGPKTILDYSAKIKSAKTLIWSGPLGYTENRSFAHGTFALARLFAGRSRGRAFGVVGGGDTLQVVNRLKIGDQIDLVSTGGGAMLDFLAGKNLPGLAALKDK